MLFTVCKAQLQYTAETEKDHILNFLDISIHRTPTNMRTSIFRKPTFMDTVIPFTSNPPTHHKYATVKFLYNRLGTLQTATRGIPTGAKHYSQHTTQQFLSDKTTQTPQSSETGSPLPNTEMGKLHVRRQGNLGMLPSFSDGLSLT
jgi:hypothetical protein